MSETKYAPVVPELLAECRDVLELLNNIADSIDSTGEWRTAALCIAAGDFCCQFCDDHGCLSMKRESLRAAIAKAEGKQ